MVRESLRRTLANFIDPSLKTYNKFAQAFYGLTGIPLQLYQVGSETYIDKGYLYNPVVFSVIKAISEKSKSIPYTIKKVKDANALKMMYNIKDITKPQLQIKRGLLQTKAFEEKLFEMPMERPNPLQSWADVIALYQTFIFATGNFYMYILKGDFDSIPLQVYVLPAHMMQIVLKEGSNVMGMENPIDHYLLTEGQKYIEFKAEEVIHLKEPNPDYGMNGEHLYGLSRLRAALRNIQSSNEAIDNNNRTLLNSGAFGFITGKGTPLSPEQADAMKSRLQEMRADKSALGQIAGASAELNFTRISATTDELKPFDYLMFDEKQICNVLGWDNKLLNNDQGAKYDNIENAERRVLVNTIMPSLKSWDDMMTQVFLPMFKGYDGTVYEHDISELPEMQIDMGTMVGWLTIARSDGAINLNEYRSALRYPTSDDPNMDIHTVKDDIIPLSEALMQDFNRNEPTQI